MAVLKQPQVITIRPDGSIAGLQRKDGFDLRQMGKAKIERASEVLWDEERQHWYVEFRDAGPFVRLTIELMVSAQCQTQPIARADDTIAYFVEYENAVDAEIQTLDHLRLWGMVA